MLNKIDFNKFKENPFSLIGDEWMLITAGKQEKFNTMTASWGGVGVMWGEPSATIYIRPQRFTKEFVDREDYFTLSFFDKKYKNALNYCGSHSGRDVDKVKEIDLTPVFYDNAISFKEAKLVMVCKKEYSQDMLKDCFLNEQIINKWYKDLDFHTMYIGKIVDIYN